MPVDIEQSNADYTHQKQRVEKFLEGKEWVPTPTLADNTHQENHTWTYWRNQLLPGILKKLEADGKVEKEEREEGGEPTHYWRLKQ
jgi:hypothetical protein